MLLRRYRLLSDSFPCLDLDELVVRVLTLGEHVGVTDDRPDSIVELRQLDCFTASFLDTDQTM